VNENIGWTELSEALPPQRREALSPSRRLVRAKGVFVLGEKSCAGERELHNPPQLARLVGGRAPSPTQEFIVVGLSAALENELALSRTSEIDRVKPGFGQFDDYLIVVYDNIDLDRRHPPKVDRERDTLLTTRNSTSRLL
jgi:hypothetical protein